MTASPFLEPRTQQFIDKLTAGGGPPVYTLSPAAARELLRREQAQPVAKLPSAIEDSTFPVGPTGSVRVRIVRPLRHIERGDRPRRRSGARTTHVAMNDDQC